MHNLQIPIYKVQCTRFIVQGSMNKILQTRTTFKRRSHYSPTSSQGRVLVKQASIVAYLTRFAVSFFPTIHATQENKIITTNELCTRTTFPRFLNQEFFFGSQVGFLKRPVSLKYWLPHPFFYKEATYKSSTKKGLLYAAKAVPSKDYFMHLTLKNARKGR